MKHPFDRSKQKNLQGFCGKLIFCRTEKAMQRVAYPLYAIPLQVIQVVPDRVIMIFVGNNANCCRHPFFAVQAVFFHSAQNVHHIGVGQCRARTLSAHRLYNINAFTQQIQPDGICKNRVVLQNGHTVLNRVLNTTFSACESILRMLEMVGLVFSDSLGNLLNLLPMFGKKMSILYQILDVIRIMQAGNKTWMQFFLR